VWAGAGAGPRLEKEMREGRWAAGLGWAGGEFEFVLFFFSFFSKPFQIFFKPFLNSHLLHLFKFKS
jgi:hypothetical protein